MAGPFTPLIMPVRATYHYDDVRSQWHVFASRQRTLVGGGVKRETTRQTFDSYDAALSFVSVFFGNA